MHSLKVGKSRGVDSIPPELLKNEGEAITTVLTSICRKILETKEWPNEWTQSLVIPLPKKDNFKQCQNYRTITLISTILLRVILSRHKGKVTELLAEEQAGFRPGRRTVEQIFNSRVIVEKHPQQQRDLFYNFTDFKKAFDRVWHAGLWQVLGSFNKEKGLVQAIQAQ